MTLALLQHQLHLLAGKLQFVGQHSFWKVWLVITGVFLVCAIWLFRPSTLPPVRWTRSSSRNIRVTRAGTVALFLLTLLLMGYGAMILVGEDFAAYDNAQFTEFSARGVDFPPQIWIEGGRFYPLALQQFNVVGHFTRNIAGYHALQIAQLFLLTLVLLALDEQTSLTWRCILAAMVLVQPSVAANFSGLIFQECDVMLWLAGMVLSIKLFGQTPSTWFAVTAALSAQIALYYKEPVFILLLVFVTARILLRLRLPGGLPKAWLNAETRLDLFIAAEALVFAAYYAIVMTSGTTLRYIHDRRSSFSTVFHDYLRMDWLVWIFVVFTFVRLYRVWRGRTAPALLWDGLACGGVAYFGVFLGIRLVGVYLLAPVDMIAVLYLGRFLYLEWAEMKTVVRAAAAVTAALVLCQNVDRSAFQVLERKWFIQQKRLIAAEIWERHQRDPEHVVKVYFPFSSL